MGIASRLQNAWNAFLSREPTKVFTGYGSSYKPDKKRLLYGHDRSIVTSVYNRIAVDVADVTIEHVRVDQNGRYTETIKSGLNNCLTLDANMDQTGKAFMQDVVMSMFDEGHVAIVPVDTDVDPYDTTSIDILTLRTGKVLEWYPEDVKLRVFNERSGKFEEIRLPKRMVALVENPFYSIMNELVAQGMSIIMISSELPEVLGMSDRLYVMSEGRITGELPIEEATEEKVMKMAISA